MTLDGLNQLRTTLLALRGELISSAE
jgi:hypothetical protein